MSTGYLKIEYQCDGKVERLLLGRNGYNETIQEIRNHVQMLASDYYDIHLKTVVSPEFPGESFTVLPSCFSTMNFSSLIAFPVLNIKKENEAKLKNEKDGSITDIVETKALPIQEVVTTGTPSEGSPERDLIIPSTPEPAVVSKEWIVEEQEEVNEKAKEVEKVEASLGVEIETVLASQVKPSAERTNSNSTIFSLNAQPSATSFTNDSTIAVDKVIKAENTQVLRGRSRSRAPSPPDFNLTLEYKPKPFASPSSSSSASSSSPSAANQQRQSSLASERSWFVGDTSSGGIGIVNVVKTIENEGEVKEEPISPVVKPGSSSSQLSSSLLPIASTSRLPSSPTVAIKRTFSSPILNSATSAKRSFDCVSIPKTSASESKRPRISPSQTSSATTIPATSNSLNSSRRLLPFASVSAYTSKEKGKGKALSSTAPEFSSPTALPPSKSKFKGRPSAAPLYRRFPLPSTKTPAEIIKNPSRIASIAQTSLSTPSLSQSQSPRKSSRWHLFLQLPDDSPSLQGHAPTFRPLYSKKRIVATRGGTAGRVLSFLFDDAARATGWSREELKLRFTPSIEKDEEETDLMMKEKASGEEHDGSQVVEEEKVIWGFDQLLIDFMDLEMLGFTSGETIYIDHVEDWKSKTFADME